MKAPAPRSAWTARSHELAPLIGRCALGDRTAFRQLYDDTSSHLFAVVLRIQRDRALAEDLLQEIYVNVWRAAGSFDAAMSQPMTWLTSIARTGRSTACAARRRSRDWKACTATTMTTTTARAWTSSSPTNPPDRPICSSVPARRARCSR